MPEYEPGKTYLLSFPSDGLNIETEQIARYPIGLPVKFVDAKERYIIVVEPKGRAIAFPYNPRWNQSSQQALFQPYDPNEDDILEESSRAEELWEVYSNPDEHRWYIDVLRHKYKSMYIDWEMGWEKDGIRLILEAADVIFGNDTPQELIDATCDIALIFLEGENPGWYTLVPKEEAEQYAFLMVDTIHNILRCAYTVKAGSWDVEKLKFRAGEDLEVDIEDWESWDDEGNPKWRRHNVEP